MNSCGSFSKERREGGGILQGSHRMDDGGREQGQRTGAVLEVKE